MKPTIDSFCSESRVHAVGEPPEGGTPNFKTSHHVKAMIDAQELARRFNEDEAVWRCYEHKRALRRLPGSRSPLPEDILDDLDWQEAEQECRAVRAVGFFHP